MTFKGPLEEFFELQQVTVTNCQMLKIQLKETLRMLWFTDDENRVMIDGQLYQFDKNQIVFLTQFHNLEVEQINQVNLLRFNRPFYCILDHDSEVGCKGILYYGAAELPIIRAEDMELDVLETAWKMATLEFEMTDSLQLEMLQMMLKRILILCTRIYKNQTTLAELNTDQNNIVREFNYLVEKHFKEKHSVAEYAELLFKSPKTISNLFHKLGERPPLQFIHERIMLEARRMLWYTDVEVSQLTYDLGFNDIQAFSRFFKKNQGIAPTEYRLTKGKEKLPST